MSQANVNHDDVLKFFDDEGDKTEIVKYSSRLEAFIAEYPPKDGWSIKTQDKIFQQGNGTHQCVRFRAFLVDPKGRKLTSRSSFGELTDYKSWQKLETNACSRLLAAIGFGSEFFDDDEITDLTDQGFRVETSAPEVSKKPVVTTVESPDEVQADVEEMPEEKQEDTTTATVTSIDSASTAPVRQTRVPKALLNNINRMAMSLKEPVPTFNSKEDAQAFLEQLLAKMNAGNEQDASDADS